MQEKNLAKKGKRVKFFHEAWGIVYLNGEYIPAEQAKLPINDMGFIKGDGVFDVCRTFNHKPYKLKEHIERLYKSLKYVRIDPGITPEEMEQISLEVLERNVHFFGEDDDFQIVQRVTRGPFPATFPLNLAYPPSPTVYVYFSPIAFENFARLYKTGRKLVTVSVRHMPPECVDPKVKHQSRLHFILALLEAQQKDPEAWALMQDLEGNITEPWGANLLFLSKGKIMTSTRQTILEGITRETVLKLANELGLPVIEGNFTPYDVYNANEALVTATSYEILPVCSLDGIKIGEQIPGPITTRLIKALSEEVGIDIVEQAMSHLSEEETRQFDER